MIGDIIIHMCDDEREWAYQPEDTDHPPYHHARNPFWSKSWLLGAFICSGGDW